MTTTFDRYVLARYLHVFAILFVSVFGLFVVIDGFSNVDEFQENAKTAGEVLVRMASFYSYQSSLFFDLVGPILTVIGSMVVFALLQRNSELHPLLAAGIPTRRLLAPVIVGTLLMNGLMAVNQELIIPRIAHVLQAPRGAVERGKMQVEPLTDHSTDIFIDAKEISLGTQQIKQAKFVLPTPRIAHRMTSLLAGEASYYRRQEGRPGGWLLKDAHPSYAELSLTDEGKATVLPMQNPKDVFIISEVSFDQLYNRMQSFKLLSTGELIRRLRNPALGQTLVPSLALHLHARLVRPLANVIVVLVAIPLVLRKESYGLVTNMAICTGVLVGLLGFSEAVSYLGKMGTLSPELAACLPILCSGTLAAWLSGVMQT